MGAFKDQDTAMQEGFEKAHKELNAFTKRIMTGFREQGVEVDVNSYGQHCYKVYVLGKLQAMQEQLNLLTPAKTTKKATVKKVTTKTKETKNVKKAKTGNRNGSKKRASTPRRKKSDGQLELSL